MAKDSQQREKAESLFWQDLKQNSRQEGELITCHLVADFKITRGLLICHFNVGAVGQCDVFNVMYDPVNYDKKGLSVIEQFIFINYTVML